MEETQLIVVSPRHSVRLATELFPFIHAPPRHDFVVKTIARREANGLPLMTAELVIAGALSREEHPAAATYPLHFRKTYFPGRLHGDPADEYALHLLASRVSTIPAPIGYEADVFRSCLIPGLPYARLTPFGGEPPENNIAKAEKLGIAAAAGLWRLAEESLGQLLTLAEAGLAHGDTELHNCIICPAPLGAVWIDFEAAVRRDTLGPEAWAARCALDLEPLLREAVWLQCVLGRQPGPLGELSWERMDSIFSRPERFRAAIETQARI